MRVFSVERRVRFDDCDPAGIVFYPRYFYMINATVEDWWLHIGKPWPEMIMQRRIVTPVSHLDTFFLRPSQMGELLQCRLHVEALSRSSFRLHHSLVGPDGHERVRARQRMVCFDMDQQKPVPWPDDVRDTLAAWAPKNKPPSQRRHEG